MKKFEEKEVLDSESTITPLLKSNGEPQEIKRSHYEPMPKFLRLQDIQFDRIKFKLFLLLITFGGLISDFYNGVSFINGQHYKKYVSDPLDPSIHDKCIRISDSMAGNESSNSVNMENDISAKNLQLTIEYSCFEKDEIYGFLTLAVLFLPGFFSIYDINEHQSSLLEWTPRVLLLPILYLLYIFCFPLVSFCSHFSKSPLIAQGMAS